MLEQKIKRRFFLGASFVGLGGLLGWFGSKKFMTPQPFPNKNRPRSSAKPAIDLSKYQQVDSAQLLYDLDHSFSTGMEKTKRLAFAQNGDLFVVGDKRLAVFKPYGELVKEIQLTQIPHCVLPMKEHVIVGFFNFIQAFDMNGNSIWTSEKFDGKPFLTAIAASEDKLFLADAGNRQVIICDLNGKTMSQFGKKDEQLGNPGFVVPSGYFDLKMSAQGLLQIANPGKLRLETYSLEGVFQSSWGNAGMAIGDFCGCCNPVFFDVFENGNFVTSEKGLSRICIFNQDGSLKGVAAGHDILVQDEVQMKQSRSKDNAGIGFDVAIGNEDQLFVADPVMNEIRVFKPKTRS